MRLLPETDLSSHGSNAFFFYFRSVVGHARASSPALRLLSKQEIRQGLR